MCKPEENEILNREIKEWKQVRGILKTGTSGRGRERRKRDQMRNICFRGQCYRRKMRKGSI